MAVAADVLTAGAASVAALLSGVNLYVSGRREEQRWNREALIEAFVTFVGASFFPSTRLVRLEDASGETIRRASSMPFRPLMLMTLKLTH
jgi:hypothetical protein